MMAVEERRRLALYDALRRTLDDDNADTLMGLLPPSGWSDVARKGDVEHLREELATQGTRFRREMADMRAELHATISANQRQLMFGLFGAVAANAGVVWAALSVAG